MRIYRALMGVAAMGVLLTACDNAPAPSSVPVPGQRGDMQCYHLATDHYNEVGKAERVEDCAGMLEAVRVQGGRDTVRGAYQGAKIIINKNGVFVSIKGTAAMPLLVRTPDGQLVPPHQMPSP